MLTVPIRVLGASALAVLVIGAQAHVVGATAPSPVPRTSSADDDGKGAKAKKAKKAKAQAVAAIGALASGTGTVTLDGTTYPMTTDVENGACVVGPPANARSFKGYVTDGSGKAYADIDVLGGKVTFDLTDIDAGEHWRAPSGSKGSTAPGLVVTPDGAAGTVKVETRTDTPTKASFAFRC